MKLFTLIFFFLVSFSSAQNKYWVSFTNKAGSSFDPYTYFDERTIRQRQSQNIPLNDSTDFPVSEHYLSEISKYSVSLLRISRWLNGVAVIASEEAIHLIKALPCVKSVALMNSTGTTASIDNPSPFQNNKKDSMLLRFQTHRMQGDTFVSRAINGSGLRIAVFDAGFPGVDKHEAFNHLHKGKQIFKTYDFVRQNENVYRGHWHGTATLSCIGGKIDSINIGLATGSEYLLAITERSLTEKFSEEENWLAAAEWADKYGVNIINSSLGYTYHRYFNNEMNGHTSLVSKASTIAASKGILVVNAAGNDGSNAWYYINAPADADSVLAVGGTDPATDIRIYFSSFGPSSDGRLKPNVSSLGEVIAAKSGGLVRVSGTSFSAPLVSGFAACAWQMHRQWSNMELFNSIEKSSHLYPYFDYAHGFGIPQAYWFISERSIPQPTFDFAIINNDIKLILREEYSYPETETALGFQSRRNLYYKIEDKNGILKRYYVLLAEQKEMLHFFAEDFNTGDVLTVHFEGYTSSLDFPGAPEQ